MAIPRRISFLEESRSQGMANLHSSGIKEDEIYSSGSSGNFEDWFIPKITIKSWKSPQNSSKFWKKFSIDLIFQSCVINWSVILKNRNKNRKISTNFWKFSEIFIFFSYLSAQKGNLVFSRSSANFGEDSRSRGVIKSIPRGIEEWKKVRNLEDRGTRNSSCHP